jgi:hypothetical protein
MPGAGGRLMASFEQQSAIHERDEDAHAAAVTQAGDVVVRAAIDPTPQGTRARFVATMSSAQLPPLPLPWPTLAKKFRMRPGSTTVVASWTSWGKSWLALELAAHAGIHEHEAVIWTNEMSEEEVVARHVQRQTGISSDDVLDRNADPTDVAIAVKDLGFGAVPCPGWPADEIARHIRHVKPDLAILDHFHQLPGISKHEHAEAAVQALTSAARRPGRTSSSSASSTTSATRKPNAPTRRCATSSPPARCRTSRTTSSSCAASRRATRTPARRGCPTTRCCTSPSSAAPAPRSTSASSSARRACGSWRPSDDVPQYPNARSLPRPSPRRD